MKGVHVLVLTRSRQKRVPRNLPESAAYPDASLELKEKWRTKEGGREKTNASPLPPSHGPLRLVNSLSRFALSHEVPEEERYLSVDHFVQMGSSPFLVRSARKARRVFGSITSQLENLFFHPPLYLAPLHMSPVYRDCPVSEISPCL